MRAICCLVLTVLVSFLLFAGCSPSYVSRGNQALEQRNSESAREYFRKALALDPENLRARRGLGLACYYLGDYDEAEAHLERVQKSVPDDALCALFLGLTAERRGDLTNAERRYRAYSLYGRDDEISRKIEGRLLYLKNDLLRQQAKEAVEFERSGMVDTSHREAVGVLPFVIASEAADSLQPLATGLAAAVMYDLSGIDDLEVVERLQLKYLLQELELQEKGLLDTASSLRLGAVAQAGRLVNGSLGQSGSAEIALQSGIVEVADSSYQYSSAFNDRGKIDQILDLQKQLSLAILDRLGITLTSKERERLAVNPTDSLSAFLDYSRGFEALDADDFSGAYGYFARAATIDPGFEEAVTMEQQVALALEAAGSVAEFEAGIAVAPKKSTTDWLGTGAPLGYEIFDLRTPSGGQEIERNPRTGPGTVSVGGSVE
ncbi:MAG: tetratricopeptide repeat protein [bacterium]